MVGGRGAVGGCGICIVTAGAGPHPAFGHLPRGGRLTHLAVEAACMLTAIADRSEGFAQDDGTGDVGDSRHALG